MLFENEVREMGGEVQEAEDICLLWVIHVDVWQKPTQY